MHRQVLETSDLKPVELQAGTSSRLSPKWKTSNKSTTDSNLVLLKTLPNLYIRVFLFLRVPALLPPNEMFLICFVSQSLQRVLPVSPPLVTNWYNSFMCLLRSIASRWAHLDMYICICMCVYICIYIYICTYVCVHVCACVCVFACVYIYINAYHITMIYHDEQFRQGQSLCITL